MHSPYTQDPWHRRFPQPGDAAMATLYDPATEHDACGVGFVARVDGARSYSILETALGCVHRLTHRGALIDARTGDGAGVLTQVPHDLFASDLSARGVRLAQPTDLAVGMIF